MVVGRGASARLSHTTLRPDCQEGDAYGLVARGTGSSVALEGCTMGGEAGGRCYRGLVAAGGAALEATGCDVGNCVGECVWVDGTGSRVRLARCRVHDSMGPGVCCVWVGDGGKAVLEACEVWGAPTGVCLAAYDRGTTATAADCELRDAGRAVVLAESRARVVLEGTTRVSAGWDGEGRERVALDADREGSEGGGEGRGPRGAVLRLGRPHPPCFPAVPPAQHSAWRHALSPAAARPQQVACRHGVAWHGSPRQPALPRRTPQHSTAAEAGQAGPLAAVRGLGGLCGAAAWPTHHTAMPLHTYGRGGTNASAAPESCVDAGCPKAQCWNARCRARVLLCV